MMNNKETETYNLIKEHYFELVKELETDSSVDDAEKLIIQINSLNSLKKISKECGLDSEFEQWDKKETELKDDLKKFGISM